MNGRRSSAVPGCLHHARCILQGPGSSCHQGGSSSSAVGSGPAGLLLTSRGLFISAALSKKMTEALILETAELIKNSNGTLWKHRNVSMPFTSDFTGVCQSEKSILFRQYWPPSDSCGCQPFVMSQLFDIMVRKQQHVAKRVVCFFILLSLPQ